MKSKCEKLWNTKKGVPDSVFFNTSGPRKCVSLRLFSFCEINTKAQSDHYGGPMFLNFFVSFSGVRWEHWHGMSCIGRIENRVEGSSLRYGWTWRIGSQQIWSQKLLENGVFRLLFENESKSDGYKHFRYFLLVGKAFLWLSEISQNRKKARTKNLKCVLNSLQCIMIGGWHYHRWVYSSSAVDLVRRFWYLFVAFLKFYCTRVACIAMQRLRF